jgi:hypothetical protein
MAFPNWPDSITKVFRHVSLELLARVKDTAKQHKALTISQVPMPGSRDTFRVTIKSQSHSWLASNTAFITFWDQLPIECRQTLNLLSGE